MSRYSRWKRSLVAVLCAAMVLGNLGTNALTAYADESGDEPICTCTEYCSTESVNEECPVCQEGGWEACEYEEDGADEPQAANVTAEELITAFDFGPGYEPHYANGQLTSITATKWGENVDRNASGYLVFKYMIPTDESKRPTIGTDYEMTISGSIKTDGTIVAQVTNRSGVQVATAKLTNTEGGVKVTLTFNDNATAQNLEPGEPGYFYMSAQFDGDKIDNKGKQNIPLTTGDNGPSWNQPVDFGFDEPEPSLEAKKESEVDAVNKQITWTITATVNEQKLPDDQGTVDVTVTDVIPDGLTFVSATVAGEAVDNVTTEEDGKTTVTLTKTGVVLAKNGSDTKVTFKIVTSYTADTLAAQQEKSSANDGKATWDNTADAKGDFPIYEKDEGGSVTKKETTEEKTATAKNSAEIETAGLTKEAAMATGADRDTTGGKYIAKWTIHSNSVYTNNMVYDQLSGTQTYLIDASHPVSIYNKKTAEGIADKTYTSADTGTTGSITGDSKLGTEALVVAADNKSANIYLGSDTGNWTITYYTVTSNPNQELSNEADLYGGPGPGKLTWKTADITPGNRLLTKHYVTDSYDPTTQNLDWKIQLLNNGYYSSLAADTIVLEDTFGKSGDTYTRRYSNGETEEYKDSGVHQTLVSNVEGKQMQIKVYNANEALVATYTLGADNKLLSSDATPVELGTYQKTTTSETVKNPNGTETTKEVESGYKLTLTKSVLPENFSGIEVTYTTKLASSDIQAWANETPVVGDHIKETNANIAVYNFAEPTTKVLNKAADQDGYDKYTHTQSWTITVNQDHMVLVDPTVTDQLQAATEGKAFGTQDWEYVADSLKIESYAKGADEATTLEKTTDVGALTNKYRVTYTQGTTDNYPSMKIELPSTGTSTDGVTGTDVAGVKYVITYKTKLTNSGLKTITDDKVTKVANSAWLDGKKDDYAFNTRGDSTGSVDTGVIKKESTGIDWDNLTIGWKVTLNDRRADLSDQKNSDGYIVLTDQLQEGLDYVDDSTTLQLRKTTADGSATEVRVTKVYKAEDLKPTAGKPAVYYDVDSRTYQLAFAADDLNGKSYELTFKTQLLSTESTSYSNSVSLSNDLKDGVEEKSEGSQAVKFGGGFTFSGRRSGTGQALIVKTGSDGTLLEGAEYTLYRKNASGTYVAYAKNKTEATAKTITGVNVQNVNLAFMNLRYGDYMLKETSAPSGYVADVKEYLFTLDAKTDTYTLTDTNYKVDPMDVTISKQAVNGTSELPGAQLTVTALSSGADLSSITVDNRTKATLDGTTGEVTLDKTNYTADTTTITWISGDAAVVLKNLPGGEYTLTEVQAPSGYKIAETMQFRVAEDKIWIWQYDKEKGEYAYVAQDGSIITMKDALADKPSDGEHHERQHTDDHPYPVTPGWERIPPEDPEVVDTTTELTPGTPEDGTHDGVNVANENGSAYGYGNLNENGNHISTTGDASPMMTYLIIALVAAGVLTGYAINRRRNAR